MKNDSEQQSGAGGAEVPGAEIEGTRNAGDPCNDGWAAQRLREDFSALNLWEADQGNPDALGRQPDSGCDSAATGALASERGCEVAAGEDSTNSDAVQKPKWRHYCKTELSSRSTVELQATLRQLRCRIEEVSAELVALLQDRQRLREEVPIRNVTIAQLLKVHEQLQLNFTEPLAIQMSVIFPDQNEALDCL